MTIRKKSISYIIVCLFITVFCSLFMQTPQPVSAKTDADFTNQALVSALTRCYNDNYTNASFNVVDSSTHYSKMFTETGKAANIYLPFQPNPISCQSVLTKVKTDVFGNPSGAINPVDYGYEVTSATISPSGKTPAKCVSIKYQYFDGAWLDGETARYCFNVNDDGSIVSEASYSTNSTGPYSMIAFLSEGKYGYLYLSFDDNKETLIDLDIFTVKQDDPTKANTWQDFVDKVDEKLQDYSSKHSDIFTNYTLYSGDDPNYSASTSDETYTKKKPITAARDTFLRYVSGNSSISINDYAFSNQDKVDIMQRYISQALQDSTGDGLSVVATNETCWANRSDVTTQYAYPVSGRGWCELRNVDKVSGNDYITFSASYINGQKTFAEMMTQFMLYSNSADVTVSDSYTPSGSQDPNTGDSTSQTTTSGDTSTIAACYQGAGVLGWIVCPVIEITGVATAWMYENFIDPALEVKANTLFSGNDSLYAGWATFRNFANIIFVICFAAIILAQLTGLGVSNYNIKKILPRLIMVAVLVNISYILCQLAVDISNILGSTLKATFDSLPVPGGVKATPATYADGLLSALGLSAIGVAGVTALGLTVTGAWLQYLILPILLSILGAFLSVLFFFIILSVRQAGIVVLIVLAPVAIVCYSLPNTKLFFDKWRKIFTSLLVVYPICGILMGGGSYVGSLLLSMAGTGEGFNFFYTITAMLVTVVPFFMIPSLLKSSMAMMGNLGMKISNFGRGFSRGAQGLARNTRLYQDRQDDAGRALKRAQNDRTIRNLERKQARGGSLVNRARARLGWSTRPSLSDGDIRRRGRAVASNAAEASELEKSFAATMQNDGSAGDSTIMGDTVREAMAELIANPENYQARARYNAAMKNLVRDDAGREKYEQALNATEYNARSLTGEAKSNAIRALKWMGNAAMDYNGGDIKKLAPSLFSRLTSDIQKYDESSTLANGITERDLGDGKFSYDKNFGAEGLSKIINSLSPESLTGLDDREIERLNAGLKDGTITGDARSKLIETTNKAFSNPNTRAKIKPKVKQALSDVANANYINGSDNDRVSAISSAAISSLDAIRDGIKDKTITDKIDDDGTVHNSRSEIVKTVRQTLQRAADPSDGLQVSTESASRMLNILREASLAGDATALDGMVDNAGQWDERYQQLTGMKIQHERIGKLSDHPEQWRQATADDVSRNATVDGTQLQVGDWIKDVRTSGPPTAGGRPAPVVTKRMSPAEIRAAEKLQEREADALLEQSDEQYHNQRQQQNP